MTLIYLVRHAQAAHGDLPDFNRELTLKGIEQSKNNGNWLRSQKLVPAAVIVSASVRTCQTLVHMAINSREIISDAAYNANQEVLLDIIRESDSDSSSLMLISHNPGISYLAMSCGFTHELHTGEMVIVEFDGDLANFDPEQAKVVHHHQPDA